MIQQPPPTTSRSHRRRVLWLVPAVVLVFAIILVILSFARPEPSSRLAQTVLIRELYAKAAAAELPKPEGVTLWQVDGQMTNGPKAKVCTGYDGPAYGPSKDLYFKDGAVTAWYSMPGFPKALPLMRYSEHATAPAFDDNIFKGSQSDSIKIILADAELTDMSGQPLTDDAKVALREQGSYDIYGRITTSKENNKEYVAECSHLALHIVIDAATGLYTDISVYKDSVNPANLSFSQTQSVKSRTGSFDQALPVLLTAGFDLERAKLESSRYTYARLVNKEAGFEFSYAPSMIGEPQLTETRSADGRVTDYKYTFSGREAVSTTIRTAASTGAPHDIAGLRALAGQEGWTIITDTQGDDSNVPGCKPGDKEWYLSAQDDTTMYGLFARTCGPFPGVYTVMPLALRLKYIDPYSGYEQESTPIAGFSHFAPGGEPSLMH